MNFARFVLLPLTAALLAGDANAQQEPKRFKPEAIPGLTDAERENATYAALRFGPGPGETLLLAFLSPSPDESANEAVWLVPGHPSLHSPQRISAVRRRRNDDGPARFETPFSIPLNRPSPPRVLEVLALEKRPGHGRLLMTAQLAHGPGASDPALRIEGAWRQSSGRKKSIALRELSIEEKPVLSLRAVRGRTLCAALRFGDWDIVLPDRKPGIPVQAIDARGLVLESEILRPTAEPIERIYTWAAEFRKLREGESYTLQARVRPGPGYPELAESLPLLIPKIP